MKKIYPLPHHVVTKIAAGEVIERPVFAVKELVENAIDAGADMITVQVEESGLKRIVVIDNGEGMSPEDLQESVKAHTTSKLSKADELAHIKTLGFRGEALASIAAISRLTINSKSTGAVAGNSIVIKDGKQQKVVPIGMPAGTTIIVDQLFHTLPVRKKFLRSPRTEFRQIIDLVMGYALSYPQIHFSLTHNKKIVLDLPKTIDPLQRIAALLGKDIHAGMFPVSFTDSYISISGFLAKPAFTTRTPSKQFLFINHRLVSDKSISLAIKSAYGSLLANNVYPIGVVYIDLPFEMVDVNVHPRKEYVRFADQSGLFHAITRAAAQALARYDLTPLTNVNSLFLSDAVGSTKSYAGRFLKEKKLSWELSIHLKTDQVMQIHNLYLLVVSDDGFLLLDQHAAHERIVYEQLLAEFQKEKKKQNLFHFPKPGIFDLSLSESELLLEHLPVLQELGWEIEQFKGKSFIIRSLPVLFQDRDYVVLLQEILEDIRVHEQPLAFDTITKHMIAYLACRGAVKAGDELTPKQAKELVEQLEKTPNNSSCPHGRPTKIAVDLERIHTLFKR